MTDFTVQDLIELLKKLPKDGRIHYHSGESNGLIAISSKNGRKEWSISRDGKMQ